ncbi:MAG: tol-pal system protein YbgF [Desulforhabdus sp.]|jgi:tol-pal system protein YbgF|nr:tol-pal system protein YbgF [Desulforhabdus sp.]
MNGRNISKAARLLSLVILLGQSWGCATPQETANLQQSINILFDRVQKLEERVQGGGNQEQRVADLYSRMEELQVRVGGLSGRIEEQQRQIDRMSAAGFSAPAPSLSPAPAPLASVAQAPAGVSTPEPKIVIQEERDPEKAMYNNTLQFYQQGKFEAARSEGQNFVAKYPKSELADNALFLVGEAYYSEKRYKEAIETYQQVLDRYPKGNKVPSALLKQAGSFQKLGDSTAARILYERLLEAHPGSPQAQLAQKELKQLQ